ncbi:hypothetical protein UT300005_06190 [Clostridium sp. CTA-5]
MKKYLNKALLYYWFNSTRTMLLLGMLLWGCFANGILNSLYYHAMNNLSGLNGNNFCTAGLEQYFILGIIFLGIYFMASGINKRNTNMFLSSGPYTKQQIKYNELICFFITLGIFVLTYIYIGITFYIRNKERLSILNGYSTILTVEVIKIIIFGIIGILFMLIIDSLFSNNTISVIFMMVFPISFICCILQRIDRYVFMWINNVVQKEFIPKDIRNSKFHALIDGWVDVSEIRMRNVFIGACILLIVVGILLVILNICQRKNSLETNIKFFASKWSEKVITVYLAVVSGIIINGLIFKDYRDNLYYYGEPIKLEIKKFITILGTDIVISAVLGIISYIIIKKLLKKFSY